MLKTEIFNILPHGEIVVGEISEKEKLVTVEVSVGEIGCWGNWLLGKLLLGKL